MKKKKITPTHFYITFFHFYVISPSQPCDCHFKLSHGLVAKAGFVERVQSICPSMMGPWELRPDESVCVCALPRTKRLSEHWSITLAEWLVERLSDRLIVRMSSRPLCNVRTICLLNRCLSPSLLGTSVRTRVNIGLLPVPHMLTKAKLHRGACGS